MPQTREIEVPLAFQNQSLVVQALIRMIHEPGRIRMLRVKLGPELQEVAVGHFGGGRAQIFLGWASFRAALSRIASDLLHQFYEAARALSRPWPEGLGRYRVDRLLTSKEVCGSRLPCSCSLCACHCFQPGAGCLQPTKSHVGKSSLGKQDAKLSRLLSHCESSW